MRRRSANTSHRHPHTLISINNMALLLQDQGKLDDAEPLMRDEVDVTRSDVADEQEHGVGAIAYTAPRRAVHDVMLRDL